jgi:hypothetical protein
LHSIEAPCYAHELLNDQAKLQLIQEDDLNRAGKLSDTITFVNTELNDTVKNFSPHDLEELDEKISALFQNRSAECMQKYLQGLEEQQQAANGPQGESALSSKAPVPKTPSSPKQKPKSGGGAKGSSSDPQASQPAEILNVYFSTNFHASHVQALISKALYQSAANLNRKQLFQQIHDSVNSNLTVT